MEAKPTVDAAERARIFAEVAERAGRLLADFAQKHPTGLHAGVSDELGIASVKFSQCGQQHLRENKQSVWRRTVRSRSFLACLKTLRVIQFCNGHVCH